MTRRKIITSIFIGIITILAIDAFVVEPNIIEVNEIDILHTNTSMKIGLISDFQRQSSDPAFVKRVVDILNEQNLDAVILAGDFIDRGVYELPSLEPLKKIQTKHGVYGVLGNHDYSVYSLDRSNADFKLADTVKEYLEENNKIKILRNENVKIDNITIIGLDSYWAGLRDVNKAYENTTDGFKILFAHNQNDLQITKETADVYLFGHTHCGQVRLPFIGSIPKLIGFEGEYDYKQYTVNDATVYTTCGLTPGPRFLNPPEIAIINLLE